MEEKKTINVSLGTVICIFIIIVLIAALGIVYYLGFVKNKNTDTLKTQTNITSAEQENSVNNTIDLDSNYQLNTNETNKIDNNVVGNKTNTIENNLEDANKCYTDGKYYYLMLYKTNIASENSGSGIAREQRRFCLMVNSGYGIEELYGWYNIENKQINLILSNSYNYDTVNNIANMMIEERNIKIKEENEQYIIALDYNEEIIKYGKYELKLQNESKIGNINKCYTDGKYYYLMLYKTNIASENSKSGIAREQRRFCLMVNSGYGIEELYGWYNVESEQINLILSNSYNYDTVNNIANMMIEEKNIKIKEVDGQYIITLDYKEENIRYGKYNLMVD